MARILIVDDSFIIRMKIKNAVSAAGHDVVGEAENGLQAITRYLQLMPDLVTLDITMPFMDGLTTLKKMLEIDPLSQVIMISAMGQQLMVLESVKTGARHFIVKPFDDENLIKVVNEVLKNRPDPEKSRIINKDTNIRTKPEELQTGFHIENKTGTFIISISPELKKDQLGKLDSEVKGLLSEKDLNVIFDFKDIAFLEEEYLAVLDNIIGNMRSAGGEVGLICNNRDFHTYLKSSEYEQLKSSETD